MKKFEILLNDLAILDELRFKSSKVGTRLFVLTSQVPPGIDSEREQDANQDSETIQDSRSPL